MYRSLPALIALFACACTVGTPATIPGRDGGGSDGGNAFCPDADGDTICDADEGAGDADGDGIPNTMDEDSDGDGVPDRTEAGDSDPSTPPPDSDGDGVPDHLDADWPNLMRDAGPPPVMDSGVDSGVDSGMIVMSVCPPEARVDDGCVAAVNEGTASLCDGADDDCDGMVDEGCACAPGSVQRCFGGPPGRRDVGACTDGTQTCTEFGWGPCEGGIAPSGEACDDLDNDCNGCTDEVTGCVPVGSCPAPGDPRVPDATPFSAYRLDGEMFYSGADAVSWRWEVEGTPCDRMFQAIPGSTATSENGQLSYRLRNGSSRNATLETTLSGDYTVTLTVTRSDGTEFTCTWIVHVRGPGLRVELCWDQTGPTAGFGGTVDLDLHLGRQGRTTAWFGDEDCHYANCDDFAGGFGGARPDWGYPNTPAAMCVLPPGSFGACYNPRLDIDNVVETSSYVPENINVDVPNEGDAFRVMVNYYSGSSATYPLVNIYCGGEIAATFGAAPDQVAGFMSSETGEMGLMWRVADVVTRVAGGVTTCDITALHPAGMTTGHDLRTGDTSY